MGGFFPLPPEARSARLKARSARLKTARRAGLRTLASLVLLGLPWPAHAEPLALAPGSSQLRLVDGLGAATIESPLLPAPDWRDPAALDAAPAQNVRRVDIAEMVKRVKPVRGCAREEGAAHDHLGPVLVCTGRNRIYIRLGTISVEPNRYYRARVRLRSPEPACIGLALEGAFRRIHPLVGWRDEDSWQERSTALFTGPKTTSLSLIARYDDPCPVRYAWLELAELAPGGDSPLRILLHRLRNHTGDPGIGIAKADLLLPLANPEKVAAPFDENFAVREAILATTPTRVAFPVRVPERARLLFSYGFYLHSRAGDTATFEVSIESRDGRRSLLWSKRMVLAPDNFHWHHARVDLEPYWGQSVVLTFRTRSDAETRPADVFWGAPVLDLPRQPSDPPNVILIAVDTLRADRLGSYGYPEAISPQIDGLASDGVRFDNAIAQSNWTMPSFASILTGQLALQHRVLSSVSTLDTSLVTLAERFREAGWTTHAILFKPSLFGNVGFDQGFESYLNVPKAAARGDGILRLARNWLERNHDRRFFLFLHFNDPHQPFTQPKAFIRKSERADLRRLGLELPMGIRKAFRSCESCGTHKEIDPRFESLARSLYAGEVAYVDSQIGGFLKALVDRGLYEDAVIGFVSDHGETLWDHQNHWGHGGPNQHDELIRVPLILKPSAARTRTGAAFEKGAVVKTQVRAFDLMPTLLEEAGLDVSEDEMAARSLTPLLSARAGASERPAYSASLDAAALRSGGWKYIYPVSAKGKPEALYDLTSDPTEQHDLSALRPDRLQALRAQTMDYLVQNAGGSFVIVVSDGRPQVYDVQITWKPQASLDPLAHIGLSSHSQPEPGTQIFRGESEGHAVVLFAGFETPPGASVKVAATAQVSGGDITTFESTRKLSYEPGLVARLARAGKPGVFLIETDRRALTAARAQPTSEEQIRLEALRALGYVE